ncbi:maleylpyruvate isomerase N-terminal domain-containing protein [Gulosibacter sp. ACHW.36C]|uniref:Maleylpyruvate isomerase N-terminal domain-containing protein n=1 Tax=Gulosibacter sediminis TaxID=1729695 RepID=A0ABY4MYE0_9MICO|nr:maleylpyruvate isomerase N-terminal domain-containing protein [Gulosibacter sediminis]UQN14774.1 maleylpyruvate isomerase N-terminal domain-containing protein [Gulosibacter sediminis]
MTTTVDRIAEEAERSSSTLAATDPANPVPTCPGWTALGLLAHVTEVHEFWGQLLATGARSDEDAEAVEAAKVPLPKEAGAVEALLHRRRAATAGLLEQLTARDDAEPVWTWFSADQSVGFVRRMQLHEATMHRVDAELTAGKPLSPIEADVAADGVGHVIEVMHAGAFDWIPEWATVEPLATLTLTPTDAGQPVEVEISRWSGTRPRDGEPFSALVARLRRADADASSLPHATASADAVALYLWLWGRGEPVEVTGDAVAVEHVEALVAQGIH